MKPRGWALLGVCIGALAGVVLFAPAAWLALAVAALSEGRLLLADARGTVWTGSARPVLNGGAGSRDAAALPGRLHWKLRWHGGALALTAQQDCCLLQPLQLRLQPRIGGLSIELPPLAAGSTRWPLDWLAGLGTPWNTLQLSGQALLSSPGLRLDSAQGRWRVQGGAALELRGVGSRLSRLAPLGSYRLALDAGTGDTVALTLDTLEGPLQLGAAGQWSATGVRLRGEARAAAGAEAALDNLLNIIGRRNGARSVLSIG